MSQADATLPILTEGTRYALLVSADGLTRILRSKAENLAARLTGEDAERLGADYNTICDQFPAWSADQVLAQLWDQGGYSWLATED